MISVNEKPFVIKGRALIFFSLRSYLPEHQKPCYRYSSEAVKDVDSHFFLNCPLSSCATLVCFVGRDPVTVLGSYAPFNV